MNAIKLFIICSILIGSAQISGQDSKIQKVLFEVNGVCNECKVRIENAALIKGVKFASWNKETKEIEVVYKTSKTSVEKIEKAIAEHGHDTKNVKANSKAYNALPDCCAYKDGIKTH